MTGPRDWDKELAEIDRLMANGGSSTPEVEPKAPADPAAPVAVSAHTPGNRPTPQPAGGARLPVRAVGGLRTWLVTLLGPIGAASLTIWPYQKACGLMLGVYLAGVLAVFGASIWAMRWAWVSRRGMALVVGTLTLVASLILAAAEILPRTGYAAVTAGWVCSP
jgi:hypothetical protein